MCFEVKLFVRVHAVCREEIAVICHETQSFPSLQSHYKYSWADIDIVRQVRSEVFLSSFFPIPNSLERRGAFSCWLKNEQSLVLSISFVRKHLLSVWKRGGAFVAIQRRRA